MRYMPNLVGSWVKGLLVLFIMACLLISLQAGDTQAKSPLSKGLILPNLELPVPTKAEQASYLGLKPGQGKTFRLSQIKKKWVLIEIFNMYCTICQGEAVKVGQLYEKVQQGPLKDRLAMIGIGVGNSPFEVKVFGKRYRIEYPLFPDGDYKIHKALGQPLTPHFLLISLKDGERRILLSNEGPFGTPSAFLKDLQKAMEEQ
jgi:peroxiredoxin